ncbi:titin homolog isoform X2 [Danio aesculapii]|uniref:titin homolog isoform X2 n=1 Tax=Danio aesculapii TaxID=1142201 RepID=UPI0024BF75AF|nr:titin homolog isoform X2 [Danio aesculapii]
MSSRRLMNRSLSSDGRSYSSGYSDISSQSRRAGCRSYLSSVRSESSYAGHRLSQFKPSRSTLCSVMAQLTEEIQPTFESTLKSKAVSEETNVKFSCVVSGYPVPEVTWYKDDIQLDRYCGLPKYEISRDDKTHTLQIYNCTLDDAAIYQASAQNSRGIVSCSGVLEVGTMSEYKIHQNYFAKLKLRNENRRREQEETRSTDIETVPASSEDIRMSSPERVQLKREAHSPLETRGVEVDAFGQTPSLEDRLSAPNQESEAVPHGISNSEQITNKEKDRQELTYIHDTVNNATSEQINEHVKKKVKISTERRKENRPNGRREEMVNESGRSVKEMEVQMVSETEHRNKMDIIDINQNEKLLVKADKGDSEETKKAQGAQITSMIQSRNKIDITTRQKSEEESLKVNKTDVEQSKRGALNSSVTESRSKTVIAKTKTAEKRLVMGNKSASGELQETAKGVQMTLETETKSKDYVTNTKILEKTAVKVNKNASEELKRTQIASAIEPKNKMDGKTTEKLTEKVNKSVSEKLKRVQDVPMTASQNKMDIKKTENQSVNINKSVSKDLKIAQGAQVASVTESRIKMLSKVTKSNEKTPVKVNKSAEESKISQSAKITSAMEHRNKVDITDTGKSDKLSTNTYTSVTEESKIAQDAKIASVIESKAKMGVKNTIKSEKQSVNAEENVCKGSNKAQDAPGASGTESKAKVDVTDTTTSEKQSVNPNNQVYVQSNTFQGASEKSVFESETKVDIIETKTNEKQSASTHKQGYEESKTIPGASDTSVTESKAKVDITKTKTSEKHSVNPNKQVYRQSMKFQGASETSVFKSKTKVDITDAKTNEKQSEMIKESASESKKVLKPIATQKNTVLKNATINQTNKVVENPNPTKSSDTQLQESPENGNLRHADNKHVDFDDHRNRTQVGTRVKILPHSCGGNDVNVDTGERNVSGRPLRGSVGADTQTKHTEPPTYEDVPPTHKEVAKELKEQPTLMHQATASANVSASASQDQKLKAGDPSAASTKRSTLVTGPQNTQLSDKISPGHVSNKLQNGQVTTAMSPSLGDETLTNTCKKESKAENQLIKESDKPNSETKPASQQNMEENEINSNVQSSISKEKSTAKSSHSTIQDIFAEPAQICSDVVQQQTINGSLIKETKGRERQRSSLVATDNVVKMDIQEQSKATTSEAPKSTYHEIQSYSIQKGNDHSGPSTFLSQHSKASATEFTIPAIYITYVDSTSQNSTVERRTEVNAVTSNVTNTSNRTDSINKTTAVIESESLRNEKFDLSQRSQLSEVNKPDKPLLSQESTIQVSSNHCSTEKVALDFNTQKDDTIQTPNSDRCIKSNKSDLTEPSDLNETDLNLKTDPGSFIKQLRSAAFELEVSNRCSTSATFTAAPHTNSNDNNKRVGEVSSAVVQTDTCKVTIPFNNTGNQVFNSTHSEITTTDQNTSFPGIKTDKSETGMAKIIEEANTDTYQGDKLKSQPASTLQSVSNSPLMTSLETQSPRLTRRTVPTDQPKPVGIENSKPKSTEKDKENQFKVPQVIRKIRPEVFDASGHLKLWCQFFNIVSDSTIRWFKDEVEIAEIKRSAGDEAQVCLAIIKMSKRDSGVYRCTITNEYGKDSTEYHLSTEFLSNMFMREEHQEVGEEIEMTPLIFSKGLSDAGGWGSKFYGRVTTEETQVGLGCEHKTRRLKVIYGLDPVFESGSSCFMKVRSPIAYESREETVLAERNLQITKQECRIQNMAREYFKIFAAETRVIESFGGVLEVIPLYFTYWPASSVPYATVEAELKGVYLRYCGLDRSGSLVINEKSEVGQKCSSLQHWIHQWTNGNVLFSRLEGVDTILTNIGVAVRSKGYQGFPCEANPPVFEQFQIQHQCNYFCGLLNLRSLKVPEILQTPLRSKGSSSPLLQRRSADSSSSPQISRKATKSPKLSRKPNPQTST